MQMHITISEKFSLTSSYDSAAGGVLTHGTRSGVELPSTFPFASSARVST
jgi:hypothetical protein